MKPDSYINNIINKTNTKSFAYSYSHYNECSVEKVFLIVLKPTISVFTRETKPASKQSYLWKTQSCICGFPWKNIRQLEDLTV